MNEESSQTIESAMPEPTWGTPLTDAQWQVLVEAELTEEVDGRVVLSDGLVLQTVVRFDAERRPSIQVLRSAIDELVEVSPRAVKQMLGRLDAGDYARLAAGQAPMELFDYLTGTIRLIRAFPKGRELDAFRLVVPGRRGLLSLDPSASVPEVKKKPGRKPRAATDAPPAPGDTETLVGAWLSELGLYGLGANRAVNLILEGVPGTGKTYAIQRLRQTFRKAGLEGQLRGDGQGRYAMTMHPATAYEDFVEGIRPGDSGEQGDPGLTPRPVSTTGQQPDHAPDWFHALQEGRVSGSGFSVQDGFFVRVCREAACCPDDLFVVLLDELNRCNLPKVMGDLLTTLEPSKRAVWDPTRAWWNVTTAQVVSLPYSKRKFFVPDNILVIGTMNTTDRSVAPLDAAMRRRFAFIRLWPLGCDSETIPQSAAPLVAVVLGRGASASLRAWMRWSLEIWLRLNHHLRPYGEDCLLGHSYLHELAAKLRRVQQVAPDDHHEAARVTASHWNHFIFPQVEDILKSNHLIDLIFVHGAASRTEGLPRLGLEKRVPFPGAHQLVLRAEIRGQGVQRTPTLRYVADLGDVQEPVSPGEMYPGDEEDADMTSQGEGP
jgi:MoxR-like ATPase